MNLLSSSHLTCSVKKLFLKISQDSQKSISSEYCAIFKNDYFGEHLGTHGGGWESQQVRSTSPSPTPPPILSALLFLHIRKKFFMKLSHSFSNNYTIIHKISESDFGFHVKWRTTRKV